MSETKNILKTALDSLNKVPETDKSVAPGAESNKPDVSNPNGDDATAEHQTNETGTAESEKSTDKPTEDDANKAAKPNKDQALTHGMKDDTKLDNGSHSDANDADDDSDSDDDDVDDSMNSKSFDNFCKSLDSNSSSIKSLSDKVNSFDETIKSLPSTLADAIAKSIDQSVTKAVIEAKNKTDLTRSEKDMDGSQDQSQKDADDGDDDEVEDSVASGHNTTDLTHSEKSTKDKLKQIDSSKNKENDEGNPKATNKSLNGNSEDTHEDTNKSLKGTAKAVQEAAPKELDGMHKETTNKSVEDAPVKPTPMTPNDIVNKSLEIEGAIAEKKLKLGPNNVTQWDRLDSVYQMAKSARQGVSEETLNKALDAFNNLK